MGELTNNIDRVPYMIQMISKNESASNFPIVFVAISSKEAIMQVVAEGFQDKCCAFRGLFFFLSKQNFFPSHDC